MKIFNLLTALLLIGSVAFAQSEEQKEVRVPVVKQEFPEEAGKGIELGNKATTQEGGKNKGIRISSAARKSSLMNGRRGIGPEMSEKGEGKSQGAPSMKPAQPGRPATVVPAAKPTPPIVRPNAPAHNKPNRPTGPPSKIPSGGM